MGRSEKQKVHDKRVQENNKKEGKDRMGIRTESK